jgi:hypothetical protein
VYSFYAIRKHIKSEYITQNQSFHRYELNKKAAKFRVENPEMVDNYDTKVQNIVQGKKIVLKSESSSLRSAQLSVLDEIVPEYVIMSVTNRLAHCFSKRSWKRLNKPSKSAYG